MAILYDVHTHVGMDLGYHLRGWWPYACNAAELLRHMTTAGIDRAVCFPFTLPSAFDPYAFADRNEVRLLPGRFPFDRENALLVNEVSRIDTDRQLLPDRTGGPLSVKDRVNLLMDSSAGKTEEQQQVASVLNKTAPEPSYIRRLLPLAMFDPGREVGAQVDAIEKLVGRIAGLKTQATTLCSPIRALLGEGRALLELAAAHHLPVLVHTAVFPQDPWSQVADCLAVAEAFPAVRFNLAHSLRFDADALRRTSQLPNVWVDCAAHLAHCLLARQDSPLVAPRSRRVDTDFSRPADVLEAIHAMLPGRYLWGSDHPYMSWCDDQIRILFSYADEAAVLHALPEPIRQSMATDAPQAWLLGSPAQSAPVPHSSTALHNQQEKPRAIT